MMTLSARKQAGISLIEVLITLVISLIILGGATQALLTNQKNASWTTEVAYVQENARFATEILSRELRGSGYWGCAVRSPNLDNSATETVPRFYNAVDDDSWEYRFERYIQGVAGDAAVPANAAAETVTTFPFGFVTSADLWRNDSGGSPVTGRTEPDALILRRVSDATEYSLVSHNAALAEITVNTTTDFAEGDLMLIVPPDCDSVTLAQVTGPSPAATTIEHETSGGSPGNCTVTVRDASRTNFDCNGTPPAPATLPEGTTIHEYIAQGFYVGRSAVDDTVPALYRAFVTTTGGVATVTREEIVTGVEDMQILYGVDVDDDGVPNRYVEASDIVSLSPDINGDGQPDWDLVTSVRIQLVMRSFAETEDTNNAVTLLGHAYNDRFMRQLVTKTVQIRNTAVGI